MIMGWFFPLGVLVGVAGTRTAFRAHPVTRGKGRDMAWWFLLALAWLPIFCWILAQVIDQY